MPSRLRLYDCRRSRLPRVIGKCESDVPAISQYVEGAQRRLLFAREAGEEGWNGTWAEVALNVSCDEPYITLPREIARLENVNVCTQPITINNQWYEYLRFGNGRLPKQSVCLDNEVCITEGVARNNAVTFIDLSSPPQLIKVYVTSSEDVGKRILIQGLDNNDNEIYTRDVQVMVKGQFLTLDQPFVTSTYQFNRLTGIQKDLTSGAISIYQQDPTTGDEVLLLTMQPSELVASYRRYYLHNLPRNCCGTGTDGQIQVTAMAKLDPLPIIVDTDYLLLTNLEAIIEECQSIRYSEADTKDAKEMAAERHMQAIRLLNGELAHVNGLTSPAINFAPFGSARLERVRIGMI